MATTIPSWFKETDYLASKLEQLKAAGVAGWSTADNKSVADLKAYFTANKIDAYDHFVAHNVAEQTSPNALFNPIEYFAAKAAQLNKDGFGEFGTSWDAAKVAAFFKSNNVNAWDHFQTKGWVEGVNPSSAFNVDAYFAAKLASLQAGAATTAAWTGKTVDDLKKYFADAKIDPVAHYETAGKNENLNFAVGAATALTNALDTITGAGSALAIKGVVSALSADVTLNAGDKITGSAAEDTLTVELQSSFNGFTGDGKLANVENIVLNNAGGISRTFDTTGISGAKKYVLNAPESSITLSNLAAAGVTVEINGQKSGTNSIGFAAKAVEGTVDALTVGLNAVGTAAVKNEAGAVTTAAKYVELVATGIEALTINATGASFVDVSAAASKTIAVTGSGSADVSKVGAITSFDASASKGAVTADLTGATASTLATVKGGEGDDTFKVDLGDLTGTAVLSGGAGKNTLQVSGSGTLQPAMTQFQTLVLDNVGASTLSGKNITDLNTLKLSGTGITGDVTVASLQSPALTVETVGAQGGSTLTLTSATALTVNTTATATATAGKAAETVATKITAGEASNLTVNVGAYTNFTGEISTAKATAVTLNVASGKNSASPAVEQTAFDGTLTANAAQSLTVKAEGKLGVTATKTITAGAATLLDVTATAGGDMAFATAKAQQVKITAGAAFDVQDSTFTAVEQLTVAANVGHTNATGVAMGKISAATLSGASATSQVTLGALGSVDINNGIAVTATGLKGGATIGTINTNGGNVTLTATDVTGNFFAGNIGASKAVGNVVINASTLGSTEVGTITAVEGASVQINAAGLLGKNATGNALTVGVTKVAVASNGTNTGSINATVSGSNGLTIGTLQAKTVAVDATGYLGGDVKAAQLGVVTGQTVTLKGTELGVNEFTVNANAHAAETSASVSATGGLKNDKLVISNSVVLDATDVLTVSFTGGEGSDTIEFAGTAVDFTNAAGSKLTLSGVESLVATKAVTVKAADVSGLTLGVSGAEAFTVKGTDAADTIDLSNFTGDLTVIAGKGNDTIKLNKANTTVDTIKFETSANNGVDTITGFNSAKDKLNFLASALTATAKAVVVASDAATTAANDLTEANLADMAKVVAMLNDGGMTAETSKTAVVAITFTGKTALYEINNDAAVALTTSEIKLVGTVDAVLVFGDLVTA